MPKSGKKRGPNAEIGHALRKAYSDAVEETIPPKCSICSASSVSALAASDSRGD